MLAADAAAVTGIDPDQFINRIPFYGGPTVDAWKYACRSKRRPSPILVYSV